MTMRTLPATPRERGFSLIVSLMMLIVIVILGVSAAQMAINEERGSRNDRDRQIAFQAAEAAIRDAQAEIFGAASPACTLPFPLNRGRMRSGTNTCFNEDNQRGYVVNCSGAPNVGLCLDTPDAPAYLNVDFYGDATNPSSARTVRYGQYTSRNYPTQTSAMLVASKYPPRYIIEAVPKNTSTNSIEERGFMFRITAMGFGANPNSQVVLQAVVATQD